MLDLEWDYGVEDPVEAEQRIYDHGCIVPPGSFVSQCLAEKRTFCVRVAETPIIVYIPEATVEGIDRGKGDEQGTIGGTFVNAIDTEYHVKNDSRGVFSQVEQVRECIAGVMISSVALECSPYTGKSGEESEETRAR